MQPGVCGPADADGKLDKQVADGMPVTTRRLFEASSCTVANDQDTFAMRNTFSRQSLEPS